MACTLAESLNDPFHRRLRQLRCLYCRFDCYRVERTSSRAGVSPAEVQRLSRRTFSPTDAPCITTIGIVESRLPFLHCIYIAQLLGRSILLAKCLANLANLRISAPSTGKSPFISPGSKGLDKPIVWVYPKLLVCLNCGFTEFAIPEAELRRLVESDPAQRLRLPTESGTHSFESEERLLVARFRQSLPALNSTADKIITAKDPFHSSEEFTPGIRLQDVTLRSSAQAARTTSLSLF